MIYWLANFGAKSLKSKRLLYQVPFLQCFVAYAASGFFIIRADRVNGQHDEDRRRVMDEQKKSRLQIEFPEQQRTSAA